MAKANEVKHSEAHHPGNPCSPRCTGHPEHATEFAEFAKRINPSAHGFSPKMVAIVGAIIGHDYEVRDRKGGLITSISITSDGFVTGTSTMSDGGGAFLGSAADLDRNLDLFEDAIESRDYDRFVELYNNRVTDWRSGAKFRKFPEVR